MAARRPDEPGPWADLALAYARQNRLDDACVSYRTAIALDPERTELYANLSGLEARRGDLDAAEALCHEALARDPVSPAARGTHERKRDVEGKRVSELVEVGRLAVLKK